MAERNWEGSCRDCSGREVIGRVLLPVPMAGVTHNWEPRRRKAKVFSSLTQEKELSCNAKIGGIAMKVLIDR